MTAQKDVLAVALPRRCAAVKEGGTRSLFSLFLKFFSFGRNFS